MITALPQKSMLPLVVTTLITARMNPAIPNGLGTLLVGSIKTIAGRIASVTT